MLSNELVKQIQDWFSEGSHSIREIALCTGVSRTTVAAIAEGRRRLKEPEEEAYEDVSTGIGRCPQCGARVFIPCRACRVRKYLQRTLADRRWRKRLKGCPSVKRGEPIR